MLSREQLIEEQQLRKLVRKAIYKVYEKKQNQKTNEEIKEAKLRSIIQDLIKEAASDPEETPHESTGINVLEGLLKKKHYSNNEDKELFYDYLLTNVKLYFFEIDFKKLTTAQEEEQEIHIKLTSSLNSFKMLQFQLIENALASLKLLV